MASLSARVESSFAASCKCRFFPCWFRMDYIFLSFASCLILLVEIKDITYLCREYDAHVTLVHIHSTQVWSVEGGALVVIVSF